MALLQEIKKSSKFAVTCTLIIGMISVFAGLLVGTLAPPVLIPIIKASGIRSMFLGISAGEVLTRILPTSLVCSGISVFGMGLFWEEFHAKNKSYWIAFSATILFGTITFITYSELENSYNWELAAVHTTVAGLYATTLCSDSVID